MRYLNPVPASENWLGEYNTLYYTSTMQYPISRGFMRYVDALLFRWGHIWSRNHSLHAEPLGTGQGRKILDIGCSSGEKLVTYVRREFEVYGIDMTGSAIADARRHVKGTFMVGTIEEAQLPESFFDFVRFDNVLEHIYDPRAFLKKVYALLKPGGTAYGYVPNGISPTMQILTKYSINSWVPFHLNLFPPNCLRMLASEAGFAASVKGIADPHMVMQSVRQWRHRDKQSYNEKTMDWIDRTVQAGIAPLSWLLNIVWQGEELALIARKY
jgi:2-polyprenyl-3-methyl-5-hydroxy-6-metoxy-1,4-benzoquinol methylase